MTTRSVYLRALLGTTALVAIVADAPHAPAQAASMPEGQVAQAATRSFAIPAQPLAAALRQFSEQSGLQLAYATADLQGLSSPGVSGTLAPQDALRLLLAGTGVTYTFTGAGTVTLARADGGGAVTLAPVTVLGSRQIDVPLSNVPSSITILTDEEIRRQQTISNRIEDVIAREVPGFNPTNNGVRNIRGRTAQVFVNGVPVNEQLRASSGADLNLITPEQLSSIEVSRGANSAYGFGSAGGIIALSTPRAESEDLTLRTRIRESFNPHRIGGSHQTSVYQSASQILGDFDYHVGGALAYDGAEFDPNGNLALGFDNAASLNNGKEYLGSFDGNVGLKLADGGQFRLTGTYGYVDATERYSTVAGVYRGAYGSQGPQLQGDDSYRESYTFNLSYQHPDVWGSALKLEAFASDVYTEAYRTTSNRVVRDEQTNAYQGFRSSLTTPLDMIQPGSSISYGLDFQRNRYYRPVYFTDTGALESFVSPDVTLDSYAAYGQMEVPFGAFVLSGGIRHEEYRGSAETGVGTGGITGGDIQGFGLTLYNAGLVYRLTNEIDLYTTFSQGAEITQLGRAARSAGTAAAIDPQPAKSNQYEIGTRADWRNLAVSLATFYTESDLLSSLQCDGVNPCVPLREPREFWGIEGKADWKIDERWGLGGVLTWQDGIRQTSTGDTRRIGSRDVPPVLVTAYLDYNPYSWWRNTLQVNYRGRRDPFGGSTTFGEGLVEDVVLVNLAAVFQLGAGELGIGVENLFNTEYVSIPGEAGNTGGSWLPEEGTRIMASYSLTW